MSGPKALAVAWRRMASGLTAAGCAKDVHKDQALSADDAAATASMAAAAVLVPSGGPGLWS